MAPPAGLLSLPDDLLATVLASLPQTERMQTIPLVCQRLAALHRSGALFRRLQIRMPRFPQGGDDARIGGMLAFLAARQRALEDLDVIVGNAPWIDAAVSALRLLAPRLSALRIETCRLALPRGAAAGLLRPVSSMLGLHSLEVSLNLYAYGPPPVLPDLAALPLLEELHWRFEGNGLAPVVPALGGLTGLTKLAIPFVPGHASPRGLTRLRELSLSFQVCGLEQADLSFLPRLPRLTSVELSGCFRRPLHGGVPPVLAALPQLAALALKGWFFPGASPFHGLQSLSGLQRLKICCGLLSLPPEIGHLTALQSLELYENHGLRLSSEDVRATLTKLRSITLLSFDSIGVANVEPGDWLALARACPALQRINLERLFEWVDPARNTAIMAGYSSDSMDDYRDEAISAEDEDEDEEDMG